MQKTQFLTEVSTSGWEAEVKERGEGGVSSYFVSVSRDVPPKGIQLSESVWDGGIFHCTNTWKGLEYTCLERGPIYLSGRRSLLV